MVTNGYKWLQMVTNGYKWLQMVTNGYKWLQMVTNGYKWSQMVTSGYKWLQMVTNGYKPITVQYSTIHNSTVLSVTGQSPTPSAYSTTGYKTGFLTCKIVMN